MIHQTFQRSLLLVQRKKENRLYPHSNSLPDSPLTVRKKARENIRGSSIGSSSTGSSSSSVFPLPSPVQRVPANLRTRKERREGDDDERFSPSFTYGAWL